MKDMKSLLLLAITTLSCLRAEAQTYDTNNEVVSTFAGYGIPGDVDGQGQLTAFSSPNQIVSDTASNLYVWDSGNSLIRKITPDATVSTFVGGGTYFEGYGTNVSLSWGTAGSMAMDHSNTLWIVMGNGYYGGPYPYLMTIGTNGYVDVENGGLTNLTTSSGICFDSANNLYYSGGNRIYRYHPDNGLVEAIAGSGIYGNYDGQGPLFSAFNNPTALTVDQAGNIYVWDNGNYTIRRIDHSQNVTTVAGNSYYYYPIADGAGTNATFNGVLSMFSDNTGNIYFVCGSCIRKMDAQTNVVTLAGNFNQYPPGYANGPGYLARFNNASGGCLSQGMIFVADTGNNRIRNISFNPQSQASPQANLVLNTYPGLQITGTIGRTYQIQSSPDMNNWTTAATLLLNSSPFLWIDQNPVCGNKFYRAVMLP
jgi:streptogramin lyase